MLEHPINPKTKKPTDFRAAVFVNNQSGTALVAYKGTTSREDWATNFAQGTGHETFYYDQAQKVATSVAEAPAGQGAQLTGHSLGGGLASAGAEATGLPAVTFNPAGLNARTVPHPVYADIDAAYVKGEVLHNTEALHLGPSAAATHVWPLEPARHGDSSVRAAQALRYVHMGSAVAVQSVLLHLMGNVDAALAQQRSVVEHDLLKNNCA